MKRQPWVISTNVDNISKVIMLLPRYNTKELSRHTSTSDCWVAVHGKVLDVTDFIRKHPGGISALTKAGRAGNDVSKYFDDVQHSATALGILETLQIGVLDEVAPHLESESESAALLESSHFMPGNVDGRTTSPKEYTKISEKNYSIRWHAARRKAILRDHPEVAALVGSNPWTCLIGVMTVIVHCYACILCQNWGWYWSIVMAYTIGAMCKMFQFAVCHDVCHDTAGIWLKNCDLLKRSALQLFTLPAMGGSTHSYYEVQHIGHHASLGSQALEDCVPRTGYTGITAEELSQSIFFPDGDGDLFAVGTLSLGILLQSWKIDEVAQYDQESGSASTKNPSLYRNYVTYLPGYHKDYKILKIAFVQFWHLLHHASITVFFLYGLALVPPFCIIGFLWPDWCIPWVMYVVKYGIGIWRTYITAQRNSVDLVRQQSTVASPSAPQDTTTADAFNGPSLSDADSRPPRNEKNEFNGASEELWLLLVGQWVRVSVSVGLHSWLWVSLNAWLLFGGWCAGSFTLGSVCKGFAYLYLSDLFLYGFGMHPYMGYFLGVHRSGGRGLESKRGHTGLKSSASSSGFLGGLFAGLAGVVGSKAPPSPQKQPQQGAPVVDMAQVLREHPADAARLCQPTMSTYSLPAALATMNLTYHVEHHDFPGVPWNRLPQVSQLAPEYYDGLEQSPGLWYTVYQWIQHSDGWSYACQ